MAWRNFANSSHFEAGIEHLRRYHAPRAGGSNEIELVKSAIGWGSYTKALDDITDVLMSIKAADTPIDEPSLQSSLTAKGGDVDRDE
jgi:hypothetical protein